MIQMARLGVVAFAKGGEVLVGEAFADANKLQPGDTLAMLLNGRRQEFRVAGVVLSPEYIFESRPGAALPDNRTYGIFWMPYKEVATAWDLYGAFNHVSLALEPGADPAPVITALDALLQQREVQVLRFDTKEELLAFWPKLAGLSKPAVAQQAIPGPETAKFWCA